MIDLKTGILAIALLPFCMAAQKPTKLKPVRSISVNIPEPSDICYNPKTDTFFIVSDNGILFETDKEGQVLRKVNDKGADYEGVFSDDKNTYALSETHRTIAVYDNESLRKIRTLSIPYSGARNKGFEAITFNKSKNSFIVLTEKDPLLLFELDSDFKVKNQIDLAAVASDISAATWHNDFLWLLSDESMLLLKLNPLTYEVVEKWSLPVINPEGLTFDAAGNLMITCDDMQRIYYFNNPEKN